jgi:hypothetical protein
MRSACHTGVLSSSVPWIRRIGAPAPAAASAADAAARSRPYRTRAYWNPSSTAGRSSVSDPIEHGLAQAREYRHGHHGAQAWRIGGLDHQSGSKRATERVQATIRPSVSEPRDPATRVVSVARARDSELAVAVAVSTQIYSQCAVACLEKHPGRVRHRRAVAGNAMQQQDGVRVRPARREQPSSQRGPVIARYRDALEARPKRTGHVGRSGAIGSRDPLPHRSMNHAFREASAADNGEGEIYGRQDCDTLHACGIVTVLAVSRPLTCVAWKFVLSCAAGPKGLRGTRR